MTRGEKTERSHPGVDTGTAARDGASVYCRYCIIRPSRGSFRFARSCTSSFAFARSASRRHVGTSSGESSDAPNVNGNHATIPRRTKLPMGPSSPDTVSRFL